MYKSISFVGWWVALISHCDFSTFSKPSDCSSNCLESATCEEPKDFFSCVITHFWRLIIKNNLLALKCAGLLRADILSVSVECHFNIFFA